jgi:hypothetical protein
MSQDLKTLNQRLKFISSLTFDVLTSILQSFDAVANLKRKGGYPDDQPSSLSHVTVI